MIKKKFSPQVLPAGAVTGDIRYYRYALGSVFGREWLNIIIIKDNDSRKEFVVVKKAPSRSTDSVVPSKKEIDIIIKEIFEENCVVIQIHQVPNDENVIYKNLSGEKAIVLTTIPAEVENYYIWSEFYESIFTD